MCSRNMLMTFHRNSNVVFVPGNTVRHSAAHLSMSQHFCLQNSESCCVPRSIYVLCLLLRMVSFIFLQMKTFTYAGHPFKCLEEIYKNFFKQGSTNPFRHSSATFIRLKIFRRQKISYSVRISDIALLSKFQLPSSYGLGWEGIFRKRLIQAIPCFDLSCCSSPKITFWLTHFSQQIFLSCDAVVCHAMQ